MKTLKQCFGFIIALSIGVSSVCMSPDTDMFYWIKAPSDISLLFPQTVEQLRELVQRAKNKADTAVAEIMAVPDEQRTFENTVQKLDELSSLSDLEITRCVAMVLKRTCPDDVLRRAATAALVEIAGYFVENISTNVRMYNALKAYDAGAGATDPLNEEQRYYLTERLKAYKRTGLELPEAERAEIIELKKEIAEICSQFETNIASDSRSIAVGLDGLAGLDQDFIDSLTKNERGHYLLGVDYPTVDKVMSLCSVEDTRKRLQYEFTNRGYPINEPVLKKLISKRDKLAHCLGFESYAAYNLDDSMAGNVETAQSFLNELISRASKKEQEEFERYTNDLPDSITLTRERTLPTWDLAFVGQMYRKKHYAIDQDEISHYFPMEKTITGLLDIYRQFLSVEFVEVPISNMWHEEVKLIQVYDKDKQNLHGYLLMDLHPRPNKYTHACEIGIIPTIKAVDGNDRPGLAVLVCNFTKSTETRPSLLPKPFVRTFFHEFGHALHHLLGRTQMASLSGTSVPRDFVEMPSQMLEEWLLDKEILKKISCHYITQQPLPDDLIDTLLELKNFDSGFTVLRQAYLSQLSLDYFKEGADKDVQAMQNDLYSSIMHNYFRLPDFNTYASFGHLTGYGAQYYGYLWSKVFALDLFAEIKKQGLLNPAIGARYVKEILAPGGSKHPNELLKNFLGREPNQEAFFKDLGL